LCNSILLSPILKTFLALLVLPLSLAAAAAAPPPIGQTITVAWRDKAPYHYVENGVEKGELLLRARRVFAAAAIRASFVREPTKRIWANLQAGKPNYCSIGWYRVPGREADVQFSVPFHADPPQVVLVAADAVVAAAAHSTLASLLADRRLTLGVADGVSYGAELDTLIARSASPVQRRTVDPESLMHMIGAGRFSYMFADVDDWDHWREHDPAMKQVLRRDFPDMPPGLLRYIVCSKDVAPTVMARLNKAIDAAMPELAAARSRRR
jgi:uncharacterized protein (TIGR02285 family)